jgi:hypothetical protein
MMLPAAASPGFCAPQARTAGAERGEGAPRATANGVPGARVLRAGVEVGGRRGEAPRVLIR